MLALHIIKFHVQPDRIFTSWRATILTQQSEIEEITNDSQALKNEVPTMLPKVLRNAFRQASVETEIGTEIGMDDLHKTLSVSPPLTLAHMLAFNVTLPRTNGATDQRHDDK